MCFDLLKLSFLREGVFLDLGMDLIIGEEFEIYFVRWNLFFVRYLLSWLVSLMVDNLDFIVLR